MNTQQDSVAVLREMEAVSCDGGLTMARLNDWLNRLRRALQSQQGASADRGEASLSAQVVERVAQLTANRGAAPSGVSDALRADAYDSWQSIAADMQKIDRLPQINHPPLSYWKGRVSALAALEAAQPQPGRVEGMDRG